jgi:tetratricopeptide (TPR) repeat protein
VSTSERLKARAGLDPARAAIARLDRNRGAEDLAADLIESWHSMEDALRVLVGSSVLSGQALIREARQRQLIDFDQANSLAEFQAVNDRVQDVNYRPSDADLKAARDAVLKLDAALIGDTVVVDAPRAAPRMSTGGPSVTGEVKSIPLVADAAGPVKVVPPPRRFPVWMLATAGVVLVVGLAIGGYVLFFPRSSSALEQGIDAYRAGQREIAVSDFNRAVRDDPSAPLPHIYLARMAREVGNTSLANQELSLALQADQHNAIALREMGALLFTQQNYELARRFYVRAVEEDPTDKTAMGYLGCTLMRLNRASEAASFLDRAGPGPWSNCTPAPQGAVPSAPGAIPR